MRIITGTGLMIINNITQIAEAIEGHKDDSIGSLFVIMIGTFNALGRLVGGGLSDYLIGRISRPSLLALALLGMSAGNLIFAFATYDLLYIAVPVCSAAYGMYWAIMPYVALHYLSESTLTHTITHTHRAILSELFGTENFGTVYNLIAIGTASGGFALNAGLASHFYSKNSGVSNESGDDNNNKCYGVNCYQPTFLICSMLCVTGSLGLIFLSKTHRRYTR